MIYTYVYFMPRRNFVIDDDLDEEFRDILLPNWYKGIFSDTINALIQNWINQRRRRRRN